MSSDAVGLDRISRVVGYKIRKGNFNQSSPNLPQSIAIFAEANEANQSGLETDPVQVLNARQAGELYGYGSPIHMIMRVLRPLSGDGVGGVPTVVYAQVKAVGATQKIVTIEPSGVATGNGVHTIVIGGRTNVDGTPYDINIEEGDTVADITAKIEDAINNVLGSPVIGQSDDYEVTLTTKWAGLTANELNVEVQSNDTDLGITYVVTTTQAGSGTPIISPALAMFGNTWHTIVLNGYGMVTSVMNALQTFNGIPHPEVPTGRFSGIVMKPFVAITGFISEDPSATTDARSEEVTIATAPAPLSKGFSFEAAANMTYLFAITSENTPHLDVAGKFYPDMPAPTLIGAMGEYNSRDAIVKKGCSTVDLVAGRFQVQDFVTTYHPIGEVPPQFRYARNLMLDFNVRYGYYLLEQINVVDHALAGNSSTVSVANVVKPKQWKQIVDGYADDLEARALIVDKAFMKNSITVEISTVNPDRLETFFRYKRSGVARIASTDAEAGFNLGTLI
jgi:phage tail sheath gpL-like